jgi:hypothetical protein
MVSYGGIDMITGLFWLEAAMLMIFAMVIVALLNFGLQ